MVRISRAIVAALAVVSLGLAGSWAHGGIVVNGGFESGNLTGWTIVPAASGSNCSVGDLYPHTGAYGAYWGATGTDVDTISQALTTVAGNVYDMDFWVRCNGIAGDVPTNLFSVSWDGVSLPGFPLNDQAAFAYTHFSFTGLQATGPSTVIAFAGRNDEASYRLDDVNVEAQPTIPEPSALILLFLAGLGLVARRQGARK
jgi:hypothetical protein